MNHTDSSTHHNCKGALCDQKLGIIISRYLIHLCEACDMAKYRFQNLHLIEQSLGGPPE